jgi:hypothetical protein
LQINLPSIGGSAWFSSSVSFAKLIFEPLGQREFHCIANSLENRSLLVLQSSCSISNMASGQAKILVINPNTSTSITDGLKPAIKALPLPGVSYEICLFFLYQSRH